MSLPTQELLSAAEIHMPAIVTALRSSGWVVIDNFLTPEQWLPLAARARAIEDYRRAGVGRKKSQQLAATVRQDRIHWLRADQPVEAAWLALMETVRLMLNRALILGLFECESHFAYYPPGGYYVRHVDAFEGMSNRRISTVMYLNGEECEGSGGELVLYPSQQPGGILVVPRGGTMVVFVSEELPHEVLTTRVDRFSIASWFRVNGSDSFRLDPPS